MLGGRVGGLVLLVIMVLVDVFEWEVLLVLDVVGLEIRR